MATGRDLIDRACAICFASKDFRVLPCGHPICFGCLENLHTGGNGIVTCPWDREEDAIEPSALPTPKEFTGKIFYDSTDQIDDFVRLLKSLLKQRKVTIQHLRTVAEILASYERKCAVSKITGSAAGLTGTGLTITGIVLTLTGVGAAVGVPMAITGAAVGAAGGATTGISSVVEAVLQRRGLKEVQEDLNRDIHLAEQTLVLLQRASESPELIRRWNIDPSLVANLARVLPGFAKVGVTSAVGMQVGLGLLRTTATTGLHIVGLALAAAVIPFDLGQMIISSIKIHKKKPSTVVKELHDIANGLEHELRRYLIAQDFFQLIYTTDGYWAYIVIDPDEKLLFDAKLDLGCTAIELEEFGEIIESGENDVPEDIKQKIYDEWYSHCEEERDEFSHEEWNLIDSETLELIPVNS